MVHQEEKIRQIVDFVQAHPGSLATRTVIRRFLSIDYEIGDDMTERLEQVMKSSRVDTKEIDLCYDLVK